MKLTLFVLLQFFCCSYFAQFTCDKTLKTDSCALKTPAKKEAVEKLEVKIKNNYLVQLLRFQQKNYLKITVKDNLGFGKTGSLLLLSNKKQFFVKSTTLNIIDKTSAYFLVDVNPQYLETIKDNGLSNIIFNETTEFTIPKTDSDNIKKMAACFFDIVIPK